MKLVDQYGREIRANKPIMNEVALQTVRDRYSTYPSQGLTPDRLAAILKEADQGMVLRQAELAEEIEEKDGHLSSVLQSRKLAVAGLSWEVLPATDSPADKKIAQLGRDMLEGIGDNGLNDTGFEAALIDILDAVLKSFSVLEIMWEISGGRVNVQSLNWVHQKRFTFTGPPQTAPGGVGFSPLLVVPRLLTDAAPVWGEELLPNKFVVHRHKARSGATPRGGLLRALAYLYLFKSFNIKDWLIFNELFAVPMRLGKYKPGATADEIEKLRDAVLNLAVDAAAVISDNAVIELLESKLRGDVAAFRDFSEFCEKTQTKVVLGHASSSEGTPGKLGSDHEAADLRQDLLESDARQVERTVRSQILAPWVLFNFGAGARPPKFKLHYEAEENLKDLAETYGILVKDAGFQGIGVNHVRERFGIPVPAAGEETLLPPAPAVTPPRQPDASAAQAHRRSAPGPFTPDQEQIEKLVDGSVRTASAALAGNEQRIVEAVRGATTWDEAIDRVLALYPDLDMDGLQDAMESGIFQAEIFGESQSKEV